MNEEDNIIFNKIKQSWHILPTYFLKLWFNLNLIKFQKARLARIRIAKASSGAAFVSKKKAAEARLAAQESGVELDDAGRDEDIFELQHHHLLRCLERTTVGEVRTFPFLSFGFVACFCKTVMYVWCCDV